MGCKGYAYSIIGSREVNQDAFLCVDSMGIYAIADGIGGGLRGEVASKMAVDGLGKYLASAIPMEEVFERLQQEIYDEAIESLGEALMGTTLTAIRFNAPRIEICHVGDSRCYLFRKNVLTLLTEDQEYFDDTVQGTVLASYLGVPPDSHGLKIFTDCISMEPDSSFLLCSDGLYRQMDETRIASFLRERRGERDLLVRELCDEAGRADYSDNVTVIYVEVE